MAPGQAPSGKAGTREYGAVPTADGSRHSLCGRVESAAQRTEVLQGFSRSSSSASSFTSVVEETEGVDGDDTGMVRHRGVRAPGRWHRRQGCPNLLGCRQLLALHGCPVLSTETDP